MPIAALSKTARGPVSVFLAYMPMQQTQQDQPCLFRNKVGISDPHVRFAQAKHLNKQQSTDKKSGILLKKRFF